MAVVSAILTPPPPLLKTRRRTHRLEVSAAEKFKALNMRARRRSARDKHLEGFLNFS